MEALRALLPWRRIDPVPVSRHPRDGTAGGQQPDSAAAARRCHCAGEGWFTTDEGNLAGVDVCPMADDRL
jgi:hypothetical protein